MTDRQKAHDRLREAIVFALFAAMMVSTKLLMNALPNVHLIAMFTILLTRFYRVKALIPIYLFVLIDGIIEGFPFSVWVMHSYIWLILWGVCMLLPKSLPHTAEIIVYPILGALHGALYGILSSPATYFFFIPRASWSWKSYTAYIASGLPFDAAHAVGNFCACMLVLPLLDMMRIMRKKNML